MELRHLRYFLTLAEELHFRRAAEKLYIAQPALTRQIKELEEQLNVTLFKRDKRNVALTLAGKYLQSEGYQLVKKVETIKSSIQDYGVTASGTITIGCIGSAMTSIVPDLIAQINEELPAIRTNIIENTTQNLLNLMTDGQIDLMFGRPHQQLKNIKSETIYRDTTVVVVAKNNRWSVNQDSGVADLKDIPFILFPREAGASFRDQIVSACTQHDFFPIIKHESISTYSILKLVERDLGISVLPKSIVRGYHLDVSYLDFHDLPIAIDMVVSYRTDNDYELIQNIVEKIKKEDRQLPDK